MRDVLVHPRLELVGAFAYTPEKVERDIGELVRLDAPIGVTATDDVEQLLMLEPDTAGHADAVRRATADFHDIGMKIVGVPVVNAIPAVCAAAPGIRTYADLPVITARLSAPDA